MRLFFTSPSKFIGLSACVAVLLGFNGGANAQSNAEQLLRGVLGVVADAKLTL
jgi:hypothetical protein